MISKKAVLTICIFFTFCGCASSKQSESSGIDCSQVLGACSREARHCVIMGIPDGNSTCDVDCQAKVLSKLYAANVSAYFHVGVPISPVGCVGYRADLGGTLEGAKCIAKVLGYEFHTWGCNEDGWAYNVRVH